jgi:RNA:NAD 2'-phosphotransferase (TPT1/KptA family)
VLRHRPDEIGLTLDQNGWASVSRSSRPSPGVPNISRSIVGGQFLLSKNGMRLTEQVDPNHLELPA